jgi:hypothetical protein
MNPERKLSLREGILKLVRRNYPEYVASGEIQRVAMLHSYTPQSAGRICRILESECFLSVTYKGKHHHAFYKAVPCREWRPLINQHESNV